MYQDTTVYCNNEHTKKPKPNLSLYSRYYAEACNELTRLRCSSPRQRQDNTAICVDVEVVASRLQRCVHRFTHFAYLYSLSTISWTLPVKIT